MRSKAILLVCAVISGLILGWAVVVDDSFGDAKTKQKEAHALEGEVKALEAENALLTAQAASLSDNGSSAAIEEAIREELGYVRADEHVLRLEKPREDRR